ncbi:hypothetical protein Back2_20110 [Nocardioides baekrokdamisoli]|uniref:Uncharacterized protein n=1 Tax=Nocardioides baekrokdamisoli TaxID=1804624 RepID=A0A3G9J2Q3_9ACTN|nr:hypothetical protein [Nocardioides baekrokdamisoli]BBH17724.1 hypothetical protein Back2_20110 [Nocardioides baekrokdamisoli]
MAPSLRTRPKRRRTAITVVVLVAVLIPVCAVLLLVFAPFLLVGLVYEADSLSAPSASELQGFVHQVPVPSYAGKPSLDYYTPGSLENSASAYADWVVRPPRRTICDDEIAALRAGRWTILIFRPGPDGEAPYLYTGVTWPDRAISVFYDSVRVSKATTLAQATDSHTHSADVTCDNGIGPNDAGITYPDPWSHLTITVSESGW